MLTLIMINSILIFCDESNVQCLICVQYCIIIFGAVGNINKKYFFSYMSIISYFKEV